MYTDILKKVGQWIFPNRCCLCGLSLKTHTDFCFVCIELLPWMQDRCFCCALPLTFGLESIYCERCRVETGPVDRICAPFEYQAPINRMISKLKFSGQLGYGRILGSLLADHLQQCYPQLSMRPQAILPVPLHPKRLLKREFNQALELALVLKQRLKLPLIQTVCTRIKNTKAQSSLDYTLRHRNLKDAFFVKAPLLWESVAIVDDVVTTGCTVRALATALKAAGVLQVDVWCLARA